MEPPFASLLLDRANAVSRNRISMRVPFSRANDAAQGAFASI
jgi:hypothetical protein